MKHYIDRGERVLTVCARVVVFLSFGAELTDVQREKTDTLRANEPRFRDLLPELLLFQRFLTF